MIRPGTRAISGRGHQQSVSTPSGMTEIRSGATPISSTMSRRDDSETVTMRGMRRATRLCIAAKPYQRHSDNARAVPRASARSSPRSTATG
jgi:hypothetical protein